MTNRVDAPGSVISTDAGAARSSAMNDQLKDLAADLAAARSLAEEGRRAPLRGGSTYVVFGVAVAACLIYNWLVVTGTLRVNAWTIGLVWFGGMFATSALARRLRLRAASQAGAHNVGNAVSDAVWRAAGVFFAVYASALFLAMLIVPERMFAPAAGVRVAGAFAIFMPATFGVYAIALAASAAAAGSTMLRRFGWVSTAFMAATALMIGRDEQLLVSAVGSLAVLTAPGLLLIQQEKRAP
ncbi:MAG: hypothetical protein K2Q06_09510 [Parvularculaceae bacterium]|nr:hypothetical protein [Parvularculaceae bacterium]